MTVKSDARERARSDFHIALGVMLFPPLLPLSWWLCWRSRAFAAGPVTGEPAARAGHPWVRRLMAVTLLDTLVVGLLIVATALAPASPTDEPTVAASPARIGVGLDDDLRLDQQPHGPFESSGEWCLPPGSVESLRGLLPVAIGVAVMALLWLLVRARAPAQPRRWGLVVVPLLLAPLLGMALSYELCTWLGGWTVGGVLLGLIGQSLTLLGLGALIMRRARAELTVVVAPRLSALRAVELAVFYIAVAIARMAFLLLALLLLFPELQVGQDPRMAELFLGVQGLGGRALLLTAAVVVAPVAEEVIFRGILLPGLAAHMRTGTALVVSSSIFALFHVPSHGLGAVMPGVLGLVFGWARLRTGGLAAPMVLHAANNLLVVLLMWAL